jgi:hypothetical protein
LSPNHDERVGPIPRRSSDGGTHDFLLTTEG